MVCRLPAASAVPDWAQRDGMLVSVTRTAEELSIVCPREAVPLGTPREGPWRALRVAGTLDFTQSGVLASMAAPLARGGIALFVVSTYDTDYILVREGDAARAVAVLEGAGHTVER
jgi:hypothetical protein